MIRNSDDSKHTDFKKKVYLKWVVLKQNSILVRSLAVSLNVKIVQLCEKYFKGRWSHFDEGMTSRFTRFTILNELQPNRYDI